MLKLAHVLRPNNRSETPHNVIFFDIETKAVPIDDETRQMVFHLGWACFWRNMKKSRRIYETWHKIESPLAFWKWVDSKTMVKTTTYLVAHNADFDVTVMQGCTNLNKLGWRITDWWSNDGRYLITFKKENKRITIVDNMNIFPFSLEQIGADLGYPKLHVDFETVDDDTLSIYCFRDVEILICAWAKWLEFIKSEDLGNFAKTIAGQSFNAYRHRFMKAQIMIHDREETLKHERRAYCGGRTECFWVGRRQGVKTYKLDVNSMYPYVMKEYSYPVAAVHTVRNMPLTKLSKLLEDFLVIADVVISTDEPAYVRKDPAGLFFPVGEFETTLCTPELKYALDNWHIVSVGQVSWYKHDYIFRDFVDYFYNKRLEAKTAGQTAYALFYKLILNTLYGKFGQLIYGWKVIDNCDLGIYRQEKVYNAKTGKVTYYRYHDGVVEESMEPEEAFNSFPAISAHVTAYARMYLWQLIMTAGRKNVLYVDTDSLFVTEEGLANLRTFIDPKRLGALKVEGETDYLEISAPKVYRFGLETKTKGIRDNALYKGDGFYVQDQWTRLGTRVKHQLGEVYLIRKIEKHLSYEIRKGTVTVSGWIEPIRLELPAPSLVLPLPQPASPLLVEQPTASLIQTVPL